MRKPIQIQIRFLRFLVKPLLIIFIAGLTHLNVEAQVTVNVDACICLSNQSVPGDGQFQADFTWSGLPTGETWYIVPGEVVGLYHIASPAPPAAPIGFNTGPTGFTLTETSTGVYEMSGKHIDGQGFSITLTNGGPDPGDTLTYVQGPGICVYPNPQITGETFLCTLESATYQVDFNAGSTYAWTLSSGGTFNTPTNTNVVGVDWVFDTPGPHDLSVTETSTYGCVISDVLSLSQEDTIALACNDFVQVSLNADCNGTLTPDMFLEDPQFEDESYELILETLDGELLPGATITSDYIGDTIMVTVLHLCSGNYCTSFMVVEDKIDPDLNCIVDTLNCDDPMTPEAVGFPMDYLTAPVLVDVNTYLVQGADLCGPSTLVYEDDTLFQPCASEFASFVVRRWYASDGAGNATVCADTLKIRRSVIADLTFPSNWDGLPGNNPALDACGDWPQTWEGHPHPDTTGYPSGPLCGDFQIDYTDIHIPLCGENAFKVVRKWFVMDWCTSEVFDTNQIIAVMDNEPPLVEDIGDFAVKTDDYDCGADVLLPKPVVIYECNSWSYTVGYKFSDTPGNPPLLSDPYVTDWRVQNNLDGTYTLLDLPAGETWVKYTVTDACSNPADVFFIITVQDSLPPVAVCDQHTVVSLNTYGVGYADAISFDDGSWDNCSEVTYKVRRMANDCGVTAGVWYDGVEFCCADVGQNVMVELQVTDANGLSNTCMAEVEVQDKRPPEVVCPPDIVVSCGFDISDYSIFGTVVDNPEDAQPIIIDDPGNPFTDEGHVWGYDGVAYDNCPVEIEIIYEGENINECGIGTIRRVFQATDVQGNQSTCVQTIRVEDFDPFYINTQNHLDPKDDVVWPKDYVLYGCIEDGVDPASLPNGYDEPKFIDDECSLIAYDYDDVLFQFVDDYCYKIVRTWSVIDWCQFDQTDPYGAGHWQYNQIIMVVDDELPQFTSGCNSYPTVTPINDNGCGANIELSATATDNCTDPDDLVWNYAVDLGNDGSIDRTGNGNTVTGNFEYGENSVTWYVEDECGNVNECTQVFEVEDHKKPTPICYDGIVTVPMPTTGTVEVFAKSFNICNGCESGSYDNCTPQDQLIFSFSSDITDVSRVFSCADIENGVFDTLEIEMWVTDLAGNQEFCNTHLILQDNQDICPDATPELFDIAGMVRTPDHQKIAGVEVSLDGAGPEFPLFSTVGSNGFYSFNDVVEGLNYQIEATSDQDPMAGISTLDLIFIQKHLLGLNVLDNAYELIAADVNGSGSISAADLLDLRKLILGVTETLPNNDSWEFVVEEDGFENNPQPFPLDETIEITGLRFHTVQNNFVGIKVGDVNQSLNLTGNGLLDSRFDRTTLLETDMVEFRNGDLLEIPVELNTDRSIEGFQFTFDYDPAKLDFVKFTGGAADLTEMNYSLLDSDNGLVTVSWNSSKDIEMGTGLPLFTMVLKPKADGRTSESLSISSELTKAEIYYLNGQEYDSENMVLQFRNGELVSDNMVLYQNTPNPFSGMTEISYYLPKANEAVLNVFDVDGKLVYEAANEAKRGYGVFILDNDVSGLAEGIYYYSVKAGKDISTRKMILIQ
jgi:hypothetical protein